MSTFQVVQHETRTIEWWFEQFLAQKLELDPSFQRRSGLWSKYKRAHLIDSVINGYDIPKFYIADFTLARSGLNESSRPYAVVDGKQRFSAFFDFFRGEFLTNATSIYEPDPALAIKNLSFEDLKRANPVLAQRILSFQPVVMSIVTDDKEKISEMFVRLNSGEALNSAERRNAQPGPVPRLVRELVQHAFFRDRVSFDLKRMADIQLATKFLMLEDAGGAVDTKASNMDRFVKAAAKATAPPAYEEATPAHDAALVRYERKKDQVIVVLEHLAEAFRSRDPLLSRAGRIPVYYLAVRQHEELVPNLRDFIAEFESNVVTAMRVAREHAGNADPKFLNYYTLSRSANDQRSIRERLDLFLAEARHKHLI